MNETPRFVEVEHCQRRKQGEDVCGDVFFSRKIAAEERVLSVLSDGLGSGVKASVLAAMTASMALKFAAEEGGIIASAHIMMEALPICRVRRISYATFTLVDAALHGATRVTEMGNPPPIFVRDGKAAPLKRRTLESPRWMGRRLSVSEVEMLPEDRIVLFSDGLPQAGLGEAGHKLGWRNEGCRDFVVDRVTREPGISARELASQTLAAALRFSAEPVAKDDMTCAVIYFRRPRRLLVLTGPPFHGDRDGDFAGMIEAFDGRKAICGGTTADIVARRLNRRIVTRPGGAGKGLPPASSMEGVDLVTEGILTLTRAARYLEEGCPPEAADAAARLVDLLRESDDIRFVVGTRVNEAHQDPSLPVDLDIRRNVVKRIAAALQERYLKQTSVAYI